MTATSTALRPAASPWRRGLVVLLAAVPPLALVLVAGQMAGDDRQRFLARLLYWAMPVVLFAWVLAGLRRWRREGTGLGPFLVVNGPGLAMALLATLVAVWVLPPAMRMQFDETSLLGTSQSMHRERIAMMATGAVPSPTGPVVIDWNLDKRPPLFPFLVSIVHDVVGQRVANAFVVNAAVLFALLALVACRTRRWLGAIAAMTAPVLVVAVPLVVVCATSAGFELLAVWLLAVVVAAALDFGREPTAPRATWLLASGLLFAQARYESVFVLAALGVVVALATRRWPRDDLGMALMVATPTVLTPIGLLLLHSRDPDFYVESGGQSLVSLGHLVDHLPRFLGAWIDPARSSPFPGGLAILSVVVFGGWLLRRRGGAANWTVVVPVLVATAIVSCWFYGSVGEPTAVRLFLPAAVLGALGPLLLPALVARPWVAPSLLVATLAFAGWRLQAVHDGKVLPRHSAAVALDAVDAALAGLRPDPQRTLLVSTVAQYLIVRGFAAMSPAAFGKRAAGLPLADVVVLETPLDEQLLRQVGDPRRLLRGARATLLGRIEGDLPVAAWRLDR